MPIWLQHGAILAAAGAGFGYFGRRMQRIEVYLNGRLTRALKQLGEQVDKLESESGKTQRKGKW